MPPRRSARAAAAAARARWGPFAALPLPLFQRVAALLSVEERLRCRGVCRAWRDALSDPALWSCLELELCCEHVDGGRSLRLLRAAAAVAGGTLRQLHLSVRPVMHMWLCDDAVRAVADCAASLEELHVCVNRTDAHALLEQWGGRLRDEHLRTLIAAAPRLRALHADVACTAAEARALLRNQPPFQALRLRGVFLIRGTALYEAPAGVPDVAAALEHAAAHASVQSITLETHWPCEPRVWDALTSTARALRLRHFSLRCAQDDELRDATALALARFLAEVDSLEALEIHALHAYFTAAGGRALAQALRASRLRAFVLATYDVFEEPFAPAIFAALTGHPTLRRLVISVLSGGSIGEARRAALGPLLGALVTSPDSRLEALCVPRSDLRDAGLGPLFDALPRARSLRELDVRQNLASVACVRQRLLPALRANASLRRLVCAQAKPLWYEVVPAAETRACRDAERLVAQRRL